jgi:site-specific DNA-adenine methylase
VIGVKDLEGLAKDILLFGGETLMFLAITFSIHYIDFLYSEYIRMDINTWFILIYKYIATEFERLIYAIVYSMFDSIGDNTHFGSNS